MNLQIKELQFDEISVLTRVASGVFDDPLIPRMSEQFLKDENHHLIIALDDGIVVGFVSAVRYLHPDKAQPELWLNEVGVAPTQRGRGIGKSLIRTTLAVGRDHGCLEAWVLTGSSNDAANRLYASVGGEAEESVMYSFKL